MQWKLHTVRIILSDHAVNEQISRRPLRAQTRIACKPLPFAQDHYVVAELEVAENRESTASNEAIVQYIRAIAGLKINSPAAFQRGRSYGLQHGKVKGAIVEIVEHDMLKWGDLRTPGGPIS